MKTVVLTDSGLKVYDQKMKTYMDEKDALLETEIDNLTEIVNNNTNRIDTINLTNIVDNLLPYPYKDTTKTTNGITFTDNGNGTVTMNGEANDDAIFLLSPVSLKAGEYTLSVGQSGFNSNLCNFQLSNSENNLWWGLKNVVNSTGVTYTLDRDLLFNYNRLIVKKGCTLDNVTWKPMIEVGNVAHPWQPYKLSRYKLRDDIDAKASSEEIVVDNLLPYPFKYNLPSTNRGITFDDYDGKGGIIANGSGNGTGQPHFICELQKILLKANYPYTFASNCSDERGFVTIWFRDENGSSININYTEIRNGVVSNITNNGGISELKNRVISDGITFIPSQDVYMQFDLRFDTNVGTVTDAIFYPMLEVGSVAHPYQPYNLSRYKLRNDIDSKANSDEIIAENLINYPYCQTSRTASGMTFTVNEDGTIHAKGKPTAATNQGIRTRTTGDKNPMILPPGTYTIHGCPKGGNLTSYYFQVGCTRNDTFFSLGNDYGEGTTFTLTEETQIQILIIIAAECPEIDLVFKPMCEVGTVIHEYQPYVLSRYYLVDNTCVHNLIPYPYYNASSDIGGIDWVDNGDGTITASGTENHSTNTNSTFWLASVYNPIFLEAGTYTFTGCPEGASAETWYVRFGDENNNFLASDIGEGCYFTLQTDQYITASLRVADNVAIPDKIVFKPMLVKGSVPREYKQYDNVEDQIIADNLIESNVYSTGFARCATKAYSEGTCILTADGATGNSYHCRDYVLEQGKVYTFSTKGNSADAKGWYMSAMYVFDTSPITYETLKPSTIYTNNYKTQSMTFAVNKECRAVRITVGIANGSATAGTKATFTEMMLEEGAIAHKYQLPKANKGYNRVDITNHSLDLNTLNLELGSPDIMQYKCRTSGGSANITNIPVASSPFNLDVEVVRWASKTDYVTRQVFVVVSKPNFEYVRWCTNGTWSEWVERKFTDTTYSNMTAATADAAGKAGLVPAPAKGNQAKFLRGDGTWQTPTNTTYSVATTSADGLMSKTDKTKLDNTNVAYGTCSTAAATAAKVITVSGNTNWVLKAGSMIAVKFTNTNTAQNPTFNVNNTGAKSVWYNTEVITKSNLGYAGYANRIMNFIYDGTKYVFIGWSVDSNSDTKNTTGTTNKVDTKLFLAGATSQGANPQTYSNANVYIGTDNCLYSNGKKVVHEVTITTDTDFDTFTETGIYHIAFTGGSNRPCANHGTLYVDTEVGTDYQLFIPDSVHTVTYKRSYDNTNKVWKDWTTQKLTDTNTTYSNMTAATSSAAGKAGLVPAPEKGAQAKFLRGDGTWQTPTNTTYSNFVKSGSGAKAGLVPAPSTTAGTTKYLREDGTWQVPPDTNTTYTNQALGQGYTTCSTAEATLAKTATITGYNLVNFGIVSVKFTYKVLANSTLNITSKGAKPIYYRGAAITDGIINAGDIATFMYNGSQYHLISIDKGILNNTTKGSLGFNSSTAQNLVPTVSTIAFWDGAYTNTTSNLAYCKKGEFGDAAIKGVDTTPTNGSVNLVTSGGVYDELNKPNYGTCSTAAATVEKAVTCTGWELKTGAEITVKFTVTNTANNPTLNVNSTGANPIYYRGSAITAGYLAANRTYTFRYNGTQYEFVGDLDSNSFDRIRYNGNIKCSATAIVTGNIIVGSNGTFQHLKLGKPFDITYPILYAGAAIAANGTGSNNYKCIAMTVTTTQSITLTQYKPVYIKGKLNGTYFTPVSTKPLTQAIPTTEDGYQYILLGLAYATNGLYLYPENQIYEYSNGSFRLYGDLSSNDIVNDLSTAVAVTNTETPVGCGVAKELNQKMLQIVSFDLSTGTLVTKSYDYTG